MNRLQVDISARFWSLQGIEGCLHEGATSSATAASVVAEWGISPETAQDVSLRILLFQFLCILHHSFAYAG
jgi:hypothetical protein